MFQEHLNAAREKTKVEFSDHAVAFLHYCVIRGIKVIIERSEGSEPMTVEDIAMGMHRQLKTLGAHGIEVEKEELDLNLVPLILFVEKARGPKIKEEAQNYINRFVTSVTRLLISESANIALANRRNRAEPPDIDVATRRIFGQGWFGW